MASMPLSDATRRKLGILFRGDDAVLAAMLLEEECSTNLPFLENLDAIQLERFRFAALKLSQGRLDRLERAVQLAKTDWRDLLMAAGFGYDIHAHEQWWPEVPVNPEQRYSDGMGDQTR